MDNPNFIRIAKLIAAPIPFALAGYSFAFSQNAVPLITDQPAEVSTPVFKGIFYEGAKVMGSGGLLTAAASSYLAYAEPAHRRSWGVVVAFSLAFFVWTPTVMGTGINKLLKISESKEMQEKATANLEARQLLRTWVIENYVRAALLLGAAVAATSAASE